MARKKGQLSSLTGAILAFVIIGVIAVIGFLIIAQVRTLTVTMGSINESSPATYTSAYNATGTVSSAMNTFVSWLPIVAIAMIGGVVLMLVMQYFGGKKEGGI
jgi:flagellar biosynthesis protein FlhB